MAIDLSKETLGFAAYYGYSKKSNPNWSDAQQKENWDKSRSADWKEMWGSAACEAIQENDRRRTEERAVQNEPAKPNVDILAITRACAT